MPMWNTVKECVKCGATEDPAREVRTFRVRHGQELVDANVMGRSDEFVRAGPDVLWRTCWRCGFEWGERPLDSVDTLDVIAGPDGPVVVDEYHDHLDRGDA
jgi:hypothetical protein